MNTFHSYRFGFSNSISLVITAVGCIIVMYGRGNAQSLDNAKAKQEGHRNFGIECMSCHTTTSWKDLKKEIDFNHKLTGYTLEGKHGSAKCEGCHGSVTFKEIKTNCVSCHVDKHKGQFGDKCQDCHTPNGWRSPNEQVAKHQLTRFPLLGAHETVECNRCHINQQETEYVNTSSDCFACHREDFQNTKEPDHEMGNFDHNCTTCHSMASLKWAGSFVHPSLDLMHTAAHQNLECAQCHTTSYSGTPTDCYGCHQNDFNETKEPDHVDGKFDHDCLTCHDPVKWKPSTFNHESTQFPLRGKHATTQCNECHTGGKSTALAKDCWSCHQKDFSQVSLPNHEQGQFDHDCEKCHGFDAWKPATFNHDITNFPLLGAHQRAECQKCHINGKYSALATDCWSCHEKDYTQVTFPNHQQGQFDHSCDKCHGLEKWKPAKFNHDNTNFRLTGAHQMTECQKCHIGGKYTGLPFDCQSCHEQDYQQTSQPNHQLVGFTKQCDDCHNTFAWQPVETMPLNIDHDKTRFPLIGKHQQVLCEKCHVNKVFGGTSTDCFVCHQMDFDQTKNPDHTMGVFDHDCLSCHTMNRWKPATFDHASTKFPLSGKHTTTKCEDCHTNGDYHLQYIDCYQCHQTDFTTSKEPDHVAGQFTHDCTTCHNTTDWKPSTFNHTTTRFPLEGAHKTVVCQDCHVGGKYSNLQIDCWSCHEKDYSQVLQPNHVNGQFNHDCTTCHALEAWKPAKINHDQTRFPLTGKHKTVQCEQCHTNGQFSNMSLDCWSCHQTDFNTVVAPDHANGQFPHDCTTCHNTDGWKPSTFDHNATQFVLQGAHARTECQKCHTAGKFTNLPTDCWSCHEKNYASVITPNHTNGQFNHDCTYCHGLESWKPTVLDHNKTNFPLTGRHTTTPCEECHKNGQYGTTLPKDCFTCHEQDFRRVADPSHTEGLFPHDCVTCHTTNGWKPSTFDHATTAFPLEGAHRTTTCQRCHLNGDYSLKYAECFQCHEKDFNQTKHPDHIAAQFTHECTTCHNAMAWKPSAFNHSTTKFPLNGAHVSKPCQDCHLNGDYKLQYTDCYQCHQNDFNQTLAPNHVAAQFEHSCESCHNTIAWKPSTFDHAQTNFPLEGAHKTKECQACHINGNYKLTYTDCYQCHRTEFDRVAVPNHVAAQFSHDCLQCHDVMKWKPSTFDHAQTKFALEGAHIAEPCQSCHVNGNYNLTYTECWQCHENDFNGTQAPSHINGKFSHECLACHTLTSWKPSTFDHGTTKFPLEGAHTTQPCEKCHINGNYALQYTDCFQCHQSDYNSVTNPNHVTGQFAHNCAVCHASAGWKPTQLNHDITNFPLTGKHKSTKCEDCHVNGNYTFKYVDCKQCHVNDFNNAKQPDHAAGMFVNDCAQCHTTNGWKPTTFSHDATNFQLKGAHLRVPCQNCHTNGNYMLTYTDCFQCHQKDYNATQTPPHLAGQFIHDCESCHTLNSWKPSTFSHTSTKFPLTGAHITTPCQNCHTNGNYNLTYNDCWQCHQSTFNNAQNPNHASGQFPHDCLACHTTSAWKPSTFSHSATNFPIQGAHQTVPCQNCHTNGNYSLTYTNCWQCHQTAFNNATNPNHVLGQFSHDCLSCHTQIGWSPATFDHNNTNFPLQGAHIGKQCQDCHINGNYQLTYSTCYMCHQSDYNGVQTPNHASNQFPQNCVSCHTQISWTPSTFSHSSTNFPLNGAHLAQPCNACHINGNYNLTYTSCYQCHQSDFTGTTNPNHVTNQFSHDCTQCHTVTAWTPSTFNHGNTNFPLAGAHVNKACTACHTNGNYNLTYTGCYMCHSSDFSGATSPANHTTLNLSHTCTTCHSQSDWDPATSFRNGHNVNAPSGFPIYGSAKHAYPNKWTNCNQCHTTNNTATFCCTGCHNNQSSLNNKHSGTSGYSFNCTVCANSGCHPDGREP